MKKTKLLYITNQICGSGGLERVLSIKASYLAEKLNYEVHMLTLNQENNPLFYKFSNQLIYHDVPIKGAKLNYFLSYRKGLKKVINFVNPDIILVCDDGIKGLLIPSILNISCPTIYERHVSKLITKEVWHPSFSKSFITLIKNTLINFGAKHFDAFIVLTEGNLKEWKIKNIKVIPNPLSFFPDERSSLQNKKVIAIGKHCGQKGYDLLLPIWKKVIDKHPDWILEIYGAFNPDHDFRKLSKNLGIENNTKFHTPVKNIKDKLIESSIHVLPSRFEGFGMVIIEAMACGVPSISFDCPHGPSDIIYHNKTGILIKNGDVNSFTDSLIDLIENENKRVSMGIAAKEKSKKYLPENIVPLWDQLFKSLLKN